MFHLFTRKLWPCSPSARSWRVQTAQRTQSPGGCCVGARHRSQESSRERFGEGLPGGPQVRSGLARPALGFGWFPVGPRSPKAGSFGCRLCFRKLTAVTATWSWASRRWGLQEVSGEAAKTQESGDRDQTGDSVCAQPRALSRTSLLSQ